MYDIYGPHPPTTENLCAGAQVIDGPFSFLHPQIFPETEFRPRFCRLPHVWMHPPPPLQQTRQKRQSGSPDKNHTFKPQLVGSTEGTTSKLPAGARVGDASAK